MNFAEFDKPLILGSFASDPAAPPAGKSAIYFNTTSNQYKFWSPTASVWLPIGSGSGTGVDFISNGDFEEGIVTPFNTFQNTAASTPPNNTGAGTGGSPTSTLTINSTNPLGGLFDAIFSKSSANYQGEGWSVDFTIDRQYMGNFIQLSLGYLFSSNFVTGINSDMQMFLLDKDAGTLIGLDQPYFLTPRGTWQCKFFVPSTSQNFRLIAFIATTNANAYTMEFDNVEASPLVIPVAPSTDRDFQYNPLSVPIAVSSISWTFTPKASALYRIFLNGTEEISGGSVANCAMSLTPSPIAVVQAPGTQLGALNGYTAPLYNEGIFQLQAGTSYTVTFATGGTPVFDAPGGSAAICAEQITGDISPVSLSDKVLLSQLITNGTLVTSTPANVGEYRALYNSGTNTFADASGFTAPNLTDGLRLYGGTSSAGSSSQPTIYQAFIGFNKVIKGFTWSGAGKTNILSQRSIQNDPGQTIFGGDFAYDPSTGVLTIDFGTTPGGGYTTRELGFDYSNITTPGGATDGYCDVEISNNPIGIGAPSSRVQRSQSTGFWSQPSAGSPVQVLDPSSNPIEVVLNCDGGDVEIFLDDDGSNNGSSVGIDARPSTNVASGAISFYMDGSPVCTMEMQIQNNISVEIMYLPSSSFRKVITPTPGQHTFTLYFNTNEAGFDQQITYTQLCARLMG